MYNTRYFKPVYYLLMSFLPAYPVPIAVIDGNLALSWPKRCSIAIRRELKVELNCRQAGSVDRSFLKGTSIVSLTEYPCEKRGVKYIVKTQLYDHSFFEHVVKINATCR